MLLLLEKGMTVDPGLLLTHTQRQQLRQQLDTDLRPEYRRRIAIMLMADAGHSQTEICDALKCSQETARYWRAIAQSGNLDRWHTQPLGRPKTVSQDYRDRLRQLALSNPCDYGYSFKRWTAHWLNKHLTQELGIEVSDRYINCLLKEMGLTTRQLHSN